VWADMRGQDSRQHSKMLQQLHRLPRRCCGSVYSCPTKYFMQAGEKVFGGLCTEDIVAAKIVRLSKVGSLIPFPFSRSSQHLRMLGKEGMIYNFNYISIRSSTIRSLHFDYLNFLCDLLFLSVTTPLAY